MVGWLENRLLQSTMPYTVKKAFQYSRSQPGCYLPNSMGGNNDVIYKLFPPRESLVSDIPAGDGNIEKLFYSVWYDGWRTGCCNPPCRIIGWLENRFLQSTMPHGRMVGEQVAAIHHAA